MKTHHFSLIVASILLASCSAGKINQTAYELNRIPRVSQTHTHPISLLVLPPTTAAAYDSTDIAYSEAPYQIGYFTKSRWVASPGQMIQPLLVKTLENTRHFKVVLSPPISNQVDYMLETQILKLEQDFTRCQGTLIFDARAQLVRIASNRVIATKEFHVTECIAKKEAYSGVIAANRAEEKLLKMIADFCVKNTR